MLAGLGVQTPALPWPKCRHMTLGEALPGDSALSLLRQLYTVSLPRAVPDLQPSHEPTDHLPVHPLSLQLTRGFRCLQPKNPDRDDVTPRLNQ